MAVTPIPEGKPAGKVADTQCLRISMIHYRIIILYLILIISLDQLTYHLRLSLFFNDLKDITPF